MKISLIPRADMESQTITLSKNNSPALFDELRLSSDLIGNFDVSKEKGGFAIRGALNGSQKFECSRTMEPFDRPFEIEIEIFVFKELGLARQQEDDGSENFFTLKIPANQNEADLTETIRQLIILQEPMIPIKE